MKLEIDIPDDRVADLLSSAWEGGSNYWARAEGQPYRFDNNDATAGMLALDFSEPVVVIDLEENGKRHRLTRKKVERGVSLLHTVPGQLAAILQDNADAATGDVLLQLAIFGEVVYG